MPTVPPARLQFLGRPAEAQPERGVHLAAEHQLRQLAVVLLGGPGGMFPPLRGLS